ncbi:hypothetical protein AAY473_028013 [Plecturocebus cupreus]
MGFHYFAQAGLHLLGSSYMPALASKSTEIKGLSVLTSMLRQDYDQLQIELNQEVCRLIQPGLIHKRRRELCLPTWACVDTADNLPSPVASVESSPC